jgi:hypothetical protein
MDKQFCFGHFLTAISRQDSGAAEEQPQQQGPTLFSPPADLRTPRWTEIAPWSLDDLDRVMDLLLADLLCSEIHTGNHSSESPAVVGLLRAHEMAGCRSSVTTIGFLSATENAD